MASSYSKLEQSAGGLRCVAVSDVGMRRASNQDSLAVALASDMRHWQSHGHLFVVADGMGAHAAGELASQIAVDTIPHSYHRQSAESSSEAIIAAVRAANEAIFTKGQSTIDFQGMGTTCSCLLLLPSGALAAHVGDSRVYRLRNNLFEQITFDHSLVWEMAKEGNANEEDVPSYVPKNVITRSLGPHETVAVDVEGPFPLQSGDRFLLCSDGLTGPLKPELIGMVLNSLPLADVAQTLVDLANLLGGPDNITVVVAEVEDLAQLGKAASQDSPITTPRKSKPQASAPPWQPWLPIACATCALGFGGLLQQHYLLAAIFGVASLLLAGLMVKKSRDQSSSSIGNSKIGNQPITLQGKAPYRQHPSHADAANIEKLSDIVSQLEELETQREWGFGWKEIHADRQQAEAAVSRGDHATAVSLYCSAVRRLMQSLRDSPSPPASDSTLDLG